MSDGDFLPKTEAELIQWATQFVTIASIDATGIGLTWASVQEMSTKRADFQTSIGTAKTAKESAEAATASKKTKMKDLTTVSRQLARTVQGKSGVSTQKKKDLGLTVRAYPEKPVSPVTPKGFTATAVSRTDNLLKWQKGDNHAGTMYEIEVKYGNTAEWQYLITVTTLSYRHKNVPSGLKISYRARALRKEQYSDYTSEVTPPLYVSEPPVLEMKKAA